MSTLKIGVIGLGYFSQFHLSAWDLLEGVVIAGVCDVNLALTEQVAGEFNCIGYSDIDQMLAANDFDIIDIVAPPPAHRFLIEKSVRKNRLLICQKPFCTSLEEAETVVGIASSAESTLIVHENFRFQPWYRTLKKHLNTGLLGAVYQSRFALRPGDGRGHNAYMSRQPTFQTMPELLLHETGVHFVDLFRWLFGDITSVYADIRKLNPVIAGEDSGILILDHTSGTQSIFDGNRLSDHVSDNPRRTMGELLIEGEKGSLRLDGYGKLYFREFEAQEERELSIEHTIDESSFGGGCVAALIQHAYDAFKTNAVYQNTAEE